MKGFFKRLLWAPGNKNNVLYSVSVISLHLLPVMSSRRNCGDIVVVSGTVKVAAKDFIAIETQ